MISISHWGMFSAPQAKFSKAWYDECRDLRNQTIADRPTSFFVSRQDKPGDPKLHEFY